MASVAAHQAQGDLLQRLARALDAAGVPYMVSGSLASAFHGEPRTTLDVDLVIDPTAEALAALLAGFPADRYHVDHDAARDALRRRSQFNLIDLATGWKVDFLVRKDRPFSLAEFARRQRADLLGAAVFVATAEDSIISKLESGQLRDVTGILSVRGSGIDLAYIEQWVDALGLADAWSRAWGLG